MTRRSTFVAAALVIGFLTGCGSTAALNKENHLDLVIRNARIVDGTGAPWYRGDVAVEGDTIVAVGSVDQQGAIEIDANDMVVSPGFIDLLGHSERAVFLKPTLDSKVRQGVTTEITGEGTIAAPISDAVAAERAILNNTSPDKWRSMGDFLSAIEQNGTAVNFALLVTTSNARLLTIGRENRKATAEELEQMKQIVDQAMCEGAIGLSTALIYVPAMYAPTEEIIELAKVAAKHNGVYFSHIRNEGDRIDDALDEIFRIGREAEIPVNVWHLKIGGRHNWGRMTAIVERIEEARRAGVDVAANVYPYIASKTDLAVLAPDWALEGGYSAFVQRLSDPQLGPKLIDELRAIVERRGPETILITEIHHPDFKVHQGKRLSAIAEDMNVATVDALVTIYKASRVAPGAMYFTMNEQDVQTALRKPWVSVGADSGAFVANAAEVSAHPRTYGTFPRVVGHYVRNEKLFSLEEAVRKVTSQAAARAQIHDRGIIRPGMKADLLVFDPDRIIDRSTYEDSHHMSEGIIDVVVNGKIVMRNGEFTGALPGRVLRHTLAGCR